ncbi:hypothetical protein D3C71_1606200 [compost metagenome]
MHAVDHFQACQAVVPDFLALQAFGNDPDHFATRRQRRIGNDAHQADRAATVHQGQLASGKLLAERDGRLPIGGVGASAGTTEHTNRR